MRFATGLTSAQIQLRKGLAQVWQTGRLGGGQSINALIHPSEEGR